MATAINVLRVNSADETASYRNAVAEILQRILAEQSRPGTSCTLVQIAEAIDVSLGTVSNAFNKRADLSPTYLNRLGKVYGAHILDPYVKLAGGRIVPLHPGDRRDVLPFITRAAARIAEARDPEGPGGEREIHTERFGYLPALLDLQRELGALIVEIEIEKAGLAA